MIKSGLIAATILSLLALTKAAATPEKYSDIAGMLRQYELSSAQNLALKEDLESQYEDDDAMIEKVKDALFNSIIQDDGDYDGDNGLLAAMMEGDESDAVAQLRIIRRIARRLRARFCGNQK